MKPKEITINDDLSFTGTMEKGKIRVIVVDGNNGTAYETDAPEHGKTIIQTINGKCKRVDYEIGHKLD
ncbi:XtrA/YqaO family protein [Bacillus sonorensis]|uniref:XtrA/YqaO family protein n=1 Tax=Bacillus sonorensis TaxID=119858 RepID=UPI000989BB94|nr:XtrA/YqaO family protein [Bacillus sonorensis]